MFSNVNDFRENDCFSMFNCVMKNTPTNILQHLVPKKKKKPLPNTTGIDQKPTTTTVSHPTNPPQATLQPTLTHYKSNPHQNDQKPIPQPTETHCKSNPHQNDQKLIPQPIETPKP